MLKYSSLVFSRKCRTLPDFIIIGAARAGTTSLYSYLTSHPNVLPAIQKETVFFNYAYHKNPDWYRMYFPTIYKLNSIKKQHAIERVISGEATPSYLIDPLVPKRISKMLPNIKLIVLLRNPVDRALSHYHHNLFLGIEKLTFEQAIKQEPERINKSFEKLLSEQNNFSDTPISYFFRMMTFKIKDYFRFSYLESGKYYEHLKNWIEIFPKNQLLIVKSEDFFSNTKNIFFDVQDFLDLPHFDLRNYMVYWQIKHESMSNNLRKKLNEFFEPYNLKLYKYLNRDFQWN